MANEGGLFQWANVPYLAGGLSGVIFGPAVYHYAVQPLLLTTLGVEFEHDYEGTFQFVTGMGFSALACVLIAVLTQKRSE